MDSTSEVLAGSMVEMPASVLLRTLARAHASGVLRIGSSQPLWAIFSHGTIAIAGAADRSIADRFRAAGLVSDLDHHSLRTRAGHDLIVAHELIERLGLDAVTPVIREQVTAVVFEMLLPSTEQFAFQPGQPHELAHHFQFSVNEVIAEAEQQLRSWVQIAQTVPSVEAVFRIRRRLDVPDGDVVIPADDWPVLAVLDGRRTISQAMTACGRDTYAFCAAVHRLVQLGVVERCT